MELFLEGRHQRAAVQDASVSGMFLETSGPLPVGAPVRVAIAPEGRRFATTGRVTHNLGAVDARELGRAPGVGMAFCEPEGFGDELFAIALSRLIRSYRAATPPPVRLRVIIADAQPRLLERMSAAFGEASFSVTTATNGIDALAACLHETPDVVLLDRALPIVDGFGVIETMARDHRLAEVPVIVMSSEAKDLAVAFEHGAMDFIAKPFSTLEVIARARRLGLSRGRGERVVLRGSLEHVAIATVLTMLEQERKTGRLVMTSDRDAWIDLVDGRIVGAGPATATGGALAAVLSALDWTHGTFELSTTTPGAGELAMPITHALLEHARLRDEAARGRSRSRTFS